jgi:hypothetical protein
MSATRVAVVACGALAVHVRAIALRRGWPIDVHPVDAILHNRPEEIAPAVVASVSALRPRYERVVVAYGDCGTRGALDVALVREGTERLEGEDCYAIFAGAEIEAAMEQEPGTYFLTDFLARSFEHTVIRQLGLDRHPELRDSYFGNYRRVVWLAQRPTAATRAAAQRAAALIGLPLEERDVGDGGLERALERLLERSAPALGA